MEECIDFLINGKTLRGVLHLPERNEQVPGIVICHGFVGTHIGLHRIFVKAAREFTRAGYAVLRFNFSGCGDSDGEHEDITLPQQIQEAKAAIEFLAARQEVDRDAVFLLGHSLGGCVAALTGAVAANLRGLVLWAPVARPDHDIKFILGTELINKIRQNGKADYQGNAVGQLFIDSLNIFNTSKAINKFTGPVIIIHGTKDLDVPPENAEIYKASRAGAGLGGKTEVVFINGADHTFSSLAWERQIINKTTEWLKSNNKKAEACLP